MNPNNILKNFQTTIKGATSTFNELFDLMKDLPEEQKKEVENQMKNVNFDKVKSEIEKANEALQKFRLNGF